MIAEYIYYKQNYYFTAPQTVGVVGLLVFAHLDSIAIAPFGEMYSMGVCSSLLYGIGPPCLVYMQIAVNSAHTEMMRQFFMQQMVHDFSPMACKLVVRRSSMVQDTLNSLVSTDPQNYKKPLQVCLHLSFGKGLVTV